MYDVCVIGLGYIGLPTASIFATKGLKVVGVDVSAHVVETINKGQIHIHEPDLDILVKAAVQSGNLCAKIKPEPASTFIIAVPTPFLESDEGLKPDLSYIQSAIRSIAPVVKKGDLIILESTSPVGTTELMCQWLLEELNDPAQSDDFLFAHCPERILPGQMLKELVSNDRIIGGLTPQASEQAKTLYESFCSAEIFLTDARTAEMAKLTENSFRDVNIAFANELSILCEDLSVDVWELIRLANRHPRVKILQPGPGVGGHCIAVDPWFIVAACPDKARLIKTARQVNDSKPKYVVDQVIERASRFKNPVVACLGLAFKADVDDLRESPARWIVEQLAEQLEGQILACEPHITALPKQLEGKATLVSTDEAIKRADIIVLLVDHKPFKKIPKRVLNERVVIDTRGIWS